MAAFEAEETEAERYARFFGPPVVDAPPEPATEAAAEAPEAALAPDSAAARYLAALVREVVDAAPAGERGVAEVACVAAATFVARLPTARAAFAAPGPPEAGPSETLAAARGVRLEPLGGPSTDGDDGEGLPVDETSFWACLRGRPWPLVARPARARRYDLVVRRGVLCGATQTSTGALGEADAARHGEALARCVDALKNCGVDVAGAAVTAWVDDELAGTRERPVAHLADYAPDVDDPAAFPLAAALDRGPALRYRALE